MADEKLSEETVTHVEDAASTSAIEAIKDIAEEASKKAAEESSVAEVIATQAVAEATIALAHQTAAAAEMDAAEKVAHYEHHIHSLRKELESCKTTQAELKMAMEALTLSVAALSTSSSPIPLETPAQIQVAETTPKVTPVLPENVADESPVLKTRKKHRRLV
jgi:hypothetical protein